MELATPVKPDVTVLADCSDLSVLEGKGSRWSWSRREGEGFSLCRSALLGPTLSLSRRDLLAGFLAQFPTLTPWRRRYADPAQCLICLGQFLNLCCNLVPDVLNI